MAGRTTLSRIAEAAGVSLATVDRVINNRGGVSPGREVRVLEAAHRLKLDRVSYRAPLRTIRIAFVMAPPENPFYVAARAAVERQTAALAHLNLRSFILTFDQPTPEAIVARLQGLERDYDAVVVTSPSDARIAAALRRLARQLPLITFVNDIPDSGRAAYFGPDDGRAGRVAGELMGRFLGPDGGDILFIAGFGSMLNQRLRERGFRDVLAARYPSCRIVAAGESLDVETRPGEILMEELTAHPGIRGVYNASSGSRSVAGALERLGIAGRAVYITHELTPNRRELLRRGLISAVIDQNIDVSTRAVLDFVGRHFGRLEPGGFEPITPFQIYLRENC